MHNSPSARRRPRMRRAALVGLALGVALGAVVAGATRPAGAERQALPPSQPVLDATHLPPLLTLDGEDVELRYDITCAATEDAEGDACSPDGSVFVRAGATRAFRELRLTLDRRATEGRYVARVPAGIARSPSGFTYYAVLTAGSTAASGTEATMTLPAGGASSPHRSLPLGRPVVVALGTHSFGHARSADERVARARWGSGPGQVGLEGGPDAAPVGGSSFDVDADGTVFVLDEVGHRVLRWPQGSASATATPVAVHGTIADLAVGADGVLHVLEGARADSPPTLSSFDSTGRRRSELELSERTATQLRLGERGPVVLQQPSGQWHAAFSGETVLDASGQEAAGAVGRPLAGGREVVVLRRGNEIRAALVQDGTVARSWRVTSVTPLAEVQLAEPFGAGSFGTGLLLVVRVYTDSQDEFRVLLLGPRGLEASYALDSADWAETAPLSRFRLNGSSLYQLGSTPAGLFVDRFDLEVK